MILLSHLSLHLRQEAGGWAGRNFSGEHEPDGGGCVRVRRCVPRLGRVSWAGRVVLSCGWHLSDSAHFWPITGPQPVVPGASSISPPPMGHIFFTRCERLAGAMEKAPEVLRQGGRRCICDSASGAKCSLETQFLKATAGQYVIL